MGRHILRLRGLADVFAAAAVFRFLPLFQRCTVPDDAVAKNGKRAGPKSALIAACAVRRTPVFEAVVSFERGLSIADGLTAVGLEDGTLDVLVEIRLTGDEEGQSVRNGEDAKRG